MERLPRHCLTSQLEKRDTTTSTHLGSGDDIPIGRPAIANERLKLNRAGQVVLQLKSPYKDSTTHIVMEPLEFMARHKDWCAWSLVVVRRLTRESREWPVGTSVASANPRPSFGLESIRSRNCLSEAHPQEVLALELFLNESTAHMWKSFSWLYRFEHSERQQ